MDRSSSGISSLPPLIALVTIAVALVQSPGGKKGAEGAGTGAGGLRKEILATTVDCKVSTSLADFYHHPSHNGRKCDSLVRENLLVGSLVERLALARLASLTIVSSNIDANMAASLLSEECLVILFGENKPTAL